MYVFVRDFHSHVVAETIAIFNGTKAFKGMRSFDRASYYVKGCVSPSLAFRKLCNEKDNKVTMRHRKG